MVRSVRTLRRYQPGRLKLVPGGTILVCLYSPTYKRLNLKRVNEIYVPVLFGQRCTTKPELIVNRTLRGKSKGEKLSRRAHCFPLSLLSTSITSGIRIKNNYSKRLSHLARDGTYERDVFRHSLSSEESSCGGSTICFCCFSTAFLLPKERAKYYNVTQWSMMIPLWRHARSNISSRGKCWQSLGKSTRTDFGTKFYLKIMLPDHLYKTKYTPCQCPRLHSSGIDISYFG